MRGCYCPCCCEGLLLPVLLREAAGSASRVTHKIRKIHQIHDGTIRSTGSMHVLPHALSLSPSACCCTPPRTPLLPYCCSQVDASATRRYGGSGLGLCISKRLCEAMGGSMRAESPGLGQGSTFSWSIQCRCVVCERGVCTRMCAHVHECVLSAAASSAGALCVRARLRVCMCAFSWSRRALLVSRLPGLCYVGLLVSWSVLLPSVVIPAKTCSENSPCRALPCSLPFII